MGVLDAFLSTWSNARQTFGTGSPGGGAPFDNSTVLRMLESDVHAAAPGTRWSGTAAGAYATANTDHGRVLGTLAVLDQRLAAQVDRSARIVAAGRRDLDAVRKWVLDYAATVPKTTAGERQLLPIVAKGLHRITDIVRHCDDELSELGSQIRSISSEYRALGDHKLGSVVADSGPPPSTTIPR